jgi:hypothetical protein
MVMAASTAAIGRLKKGRMLPSDLMSEVTKALCVPKISFVLIDDRIAYPGRHARSARVHSGHPGLAIQVEKPT